MKSSTLRRLTIVAGFFALVMVMSTSFGMKVQAISQQIVDLECKVEVIDCPGWGTGDRQVCHTNGNGVGCSCGTSTKCGAVEEPAN